jgi:hypothetical protein
MIAPRFSLAFLFATTALVGFSLANWLYLGPCAAFLSLLGASGYWLGIYWMARASSDKTNSWRMTFGILVLLLSVAALTALALIAILSLANQLR